MDLPRPVLECHFGQLLETRHLLQALEQRAAREGLQLEGARRRLDLDHQTAAAEAREPQARGAHAEDLRDRLLHLPKLQRPRSGKLELREDAAEPVQARALTGSSA